MTCVSCGIDDTMYTITVKVCREDFEKVNNALTKAVFGSLLGDLERITIKKENDLARHPCLYPVRNS